MNSCCLEDKKDSIEYKSFICFCSTLTCNCLTLHVMTTKIDGHPHRAQDGTKGSIQITNQDKSEIATVSFPDDLSFCITCN